MVSAMREMLVKIGVIEDNIRTEDIYFDNFKFWIN
jgi:hypothetical protein